MDDLPEEKLGMSQSIESVSSVEPTFADGAESTMVSGNESKDDSLKKNELQTAPEAEMTHVSRSVSSVEPTFADGAESTMVSGNESKDESMKKSEGSESDHAEISHGTNIVTSTPRSSIECEESTIPGGVVPGPSGDDSKIMKDKRVRKWLQEQSTNIPTPLRHLHPLQTAPEAEMTHVSRSVSSVEPTFADGAESTMVSGNESKDDSLKKSEGSESDHAEISHGTNIVTSTPRSSIECEESKIPGGVVPGPPGDDSKIMKDKRVRKWLQEQSTNIPTPLRHLHPLQTAPEAEMTHVSRSVSSVDPTFEYGSESSTIVSGNQSKNESLKTNEPSQSDKSTRTADADISKDGINIVTSTPRSSIQSGEFTVPGGVVPGPSGDDSQFVKDKRIRKWLQEQSTNIPTPLRHLHPLLTASEAEITHVSATTDSTSEPRFHEPLKKQHTHTSSPTLSETISSVTPGGVVPGPSGDDSQIVKDKRIRKWLQEQSTNIPTPLRHLHPLLTASEAEITHVSATTDSTSEPSFHEAVKKQHTHTSSPTLPETIGSVTPSVIVIDSTQGSDSENPETTLKADNVSLENTIITISDESKAESVNLEISSDPKPEASYTESSVYSNLVKFMESIGLPTTFREDKSLKENSEPGISSDSKPEESTKPSVQTTSSWEDKSLMEKSKSVIVIDSTQGSDSENPETTLKADNVSLENTIITISDESKAESVNSVIVIDSTQGSDSENPETTLKADNVSLENTIITISDESKAESVNLEISSDPKPGASKSSIGLQTTSLEDKSLMENSQSVTVIDSSADPDSINLETTSQKSSELKEAK